MDNAASIQAKAEKQQASRAIPSSNSYRYLNSIVATMDNSASKQ